MYSIVSQYISNMNFKNKRLTCKILFEEARDRYWIFIATIISSFLFDYLAWEKFPFDNIQLTEKNEDKFRNFFFLTCRNSLERFEMTSVFRGMALRI